MLIRGFGAAEEDLFLLMVPKDGVGGRLGVRTSAAAMLKVGDN